MLYINWKYASNENMRFLISCDRFISFLFTKIFIHYEVGWFGQNYLVSFDVCKYA